MPDLRSVDEHLASILAATTPSPAVELPLLDALDLAAAEDVVATIRLPRFDNSAMDGYAVHSADVAAAADRAPVTLPVIGEIGAGQAESGVHDLPPGSAAKIMTGAPMPAGADTVVPYEWTDRGATEVTITRAAAPRQHVRFAGEDVATGDLVVEAGTALGPRHLGLLASLGRPSVLVRPRPRVLVVSTGSELRDPGEELDADSIYDGNSYLLSGSVRRAGGVASRVGLVPDRPQAFLDALAERLPETDVVVTSGGISMGDYDVVKEALLSVGTVWFGGLAMQPGKPQGFGHLVSPDDPGRRVPFFALPGNPVSSYLSFEVFVRPALRRMLGLTPETRRPVTARLTHAVTSPPGRRQFLRGVVTVGPDGTTVTEVEPVGGSGSHLVGDLAASDALIVVPEDVTAVAAGERVTVIRLDQD
ncbi:molybdopterin molybdotransferase MoeA [Nocardioides dongxiaopingii]|uniref:molybdotransferase-like divisome protein Glp n=1 Tax=Nocardioides sp. S-1144 TaxID=2582905 RepID=UPI00110F5258|nr:gephyrin-like molybdotransferase Glp [Nocardioides sp. S-1144]QCW51618.1 molybdopterin molybdotransferase MoeA [Nocardioides sp. S-1144]